MIDERTQASSSKHATSTDGYLSQPSRQDTSILKNDSVNLTAAYWKAQTALDTASPDTSPEELSKLKLATGRTLRNLQLMDDEWERRVTEGLETKDSCAPGREPGWASPHDALSQADSCKTDVTVKGT